VPRNVAPACFNREIRHEASSSSRQEKDISLAQCQCYSFKVHIRKARPVDSWGMTKMNVMASEQFENSRRLRILFWHQVSGRKGFLDHATVEYGSRSSHLYASRIIHSPLYHQDRSSEHFGSRASNVTFQPNNHKLTAVRAKVSVVSNEQLTFQTTYLSSSSIASPMFQLPQYLMQCCLT
jgi:hypothetical protein